MLIWRQDYFGMALLSKERPLSTVAASNTALTKKNFTDDLLGIISEWWFSLLLQVIFVYFQSSYFSQLQIKQQPVSVCVHECMCGYSTVSLQDETYCIYST